MAISTTRASDPRHDGDRSVSRVSKAEQRAVDAADQVDQHTDVSDEDATDLSDEPVEDSVVAGAQGSAAGCIPIGNFEQDFTGNNVLVGNTFRVIDTAKLFQYGFVLESTTVTPVSADLHFTIYSRPSDSTDLFVKTFDTVVSREIMPDPSIQLTDPLIEPLTLESGKDYAFTVAWTLPSLRYANDQDQSGTSGQVFPEFPIAEYRGVSVVVSPGFPTPDEIGLFISTSPGPLAVEICLTGACCHDADGSDTADDCVDASLGTCNDLDLWSLGSPGTTCEGIGLEGLDCPFPIGPCCINDVCANLNKFDCEETGGTWFDPAVNGLENCVDAGDEFCTPKGACCSTGGQCVENQTQESCEAAGGLYNGDDSLCEELEPGCTVGACCLGPNICVNQALEDCDPQNTDNEWRGYGSFCVPDDTCAIKGACCLGASCEDLSQEDCEFQAGNYRGDNTACDTLPVVCGNGACCRDNGCDDNNGLGLSQNDCSIFNGSFSGDGTTCDTIVACEGLCCESDGTCTEADAVACSLVGHYGGFEVPGGCDATDPCVQPIGAKGVCCAPNGDCILAFESACAALFDGGIIPPGRWEPGEQLTCVTTSLVCEPLDPVGGCCSLVDGTCELTSEADCVGTFRGVGVGCPEDGDDACEPGTCCLPIGGTYSPCAIRAECDAVGGNFSAGCEQLCFPGQPCCLTTDECVVLTAQSCLDSGGDPRSGPAECLAIFDCGFGACCENGECTDKFAIGCTGTYFGDDSECEPNGCALGACCFDDETCTEIEQILCSTLGGTFIGEGSTCDDGVCNLGACCRGDGTCDEDLFAFQCASGLADHFQAATCNDIAAICNPRGLCCVNDDCIVIDPDNNIDFVDADVCETVLSGLAGPAGSRCGDYAGDACDLGSCCVDDTCTENLRLFECDAMGGDFRLDSDCSAPCNVEGACCYLDGTCENNIQGFECAKAEGELTEDGNCQFINCEARGACCQKDGTCSILPELFCNILSGVYRGDATSCNTASCEQGACCDGTTCTDDVYADACPGVFLGEQTVCGVDSCEFGACCDADVCNDVLGFDCSANFAGEGNLCVDVSCEPGGCCIGLTCTEVADETVCLSMGGRYTDTPDCTDVDCLAIESTDPADGSIDARQATQPDGTGAFGWSALRITFNGPPGDLIPSDFSINSSGGNAPMIMEIVPKSENTIDVLLDGPIPVGEWTWITHDGTGTTTCLGYLPGDADGNSLVNGDDILAHIDALDGNLVLPVYASDVDQSGATEPDDLLRLIDLMNGAEEFDAWFDATLGTCGG
jgi:hypothetical protein